MFKTVFDTAYQIGDAFLQIVADVVLKQNPASFMELQTVHNGTTLVFKDGTLISFIALHGAMTTVVEEQYDSMVAKLESRVKNFIANGKHELQWFFSVDDDRVKDELECNFAVPARETLKRMQLAGCIPLVDEQVNKYAEFCHQEANYIVIATRPKSLTKAEQSAIKELRLKKSIGAPSAIPFHGSEVFEASHQSAVDNLIIDLADVGISSEVESIERSLLEIRKSNDAEWTPSDWKPICLGSKYHFRVPETKRGSYGFLGVPSLSEQILPRDIVELSRGIMQIGSVFYAPMTIKLLPSEPLPFSKLLATTRSERIPFRIRFDISDNGMGIFAFKSVVASLLMNKGNNKYIIDIEKQLSELRDHGHSVHKLKVAICTWHRDKKQLEVNREKLARMFASWGGGELCQIEADVVEGYVSSVPGATLRSSAPTTAIPLYETTKMLPLDRPCSVWRSGSQLNRTQDGKIMYFEPVSSKQASWINLILGSMGSGKSVAMSYSNWSFLINPNNTELPYISLLDIGESSKSFVEFIRDNLPETKKHLATYVKLKNTKEFAINFNDTFLGQRKPTSFHRDFIVSIYSFLCINTETEKVPEGVESFVSSILDMAFSDASKRKSAFRYFPNILIEVDDLLLKHNFGETTAFTTWWEIVDFLFSKGEYRHARLVQRQAVPFLSTYIALCSDDRIKSEFESVYVGEEPLSNYVKRKLLDVVKMYPLLAERTRFDLDESKIISLDLHDVAKGTGPTASRRRALMYLSGLYIIGNKFQISTDYLPEIDDQEGCEYKRYYENLLTELERVAKRLSMDEKHRANISSDCDDIVNQILDTYALESRKWKIDLTQASQSSSHISPAYKEFATSIMLMKPGTDADIANSIKSFKLNNSMQYHLANSLHKPNRKGASFLGLYSTESGWVNQLQMITLGPIFLWSTTSDRNDSWVRKELIKHLGTEKARGVLVKHFPSGSVADEVKRIQKVREINNDETNQAILAEIVETVLLSISREG